MGVDGCRSLVVSWDREVGREAGRKGTRYVKLVSWAYCDGRRRWWRTGGDPGPGPDVAVVVDLPRERSGVTSPFVIQEDVPLSWPHLWSVPCVETEPVTYPSWSRVGPCFTTDFSRVVVITTVGVRRTESLWWQSSLVQCKTPMTGVLQLSRSLSVSSFWSF